MVMEAGSRPRRLGRAVDDVALVQEGIEPAPGAGVPPVGLTSDQRQHQLLTGAADEDGRGRLGRGGA